MIDTIEARRECFRSQFRREVDGDVDGILVMIVFVSCGLVPVGIEPLAYRVHRSRKLSRVEPDRDAAHQPPTACPLRDVSTFLPQAKAVIFLS